MTMLVYTLKYNFVIFCNRCNKGVTYLRLVHLNIRWQRSVLPAFTNTFCLFVFGRHSPQWARASSFTRLLDYTQRRTTIGRTTLDEWSARRRDLYLTTHNTHNRNTSMSPVGFEPTISAGERPQTYVSDRAATGTGLPIGTVMFACHFCVRSKLNYLLRTQCLLFIYLKFRDCSLQL